MLQVGVGSVVIPPAHVWAWMRQSRGSIYRKKQTGYARPRECSGRRPCKELYAQRASSKDSTWKRLRVDNLLVDVERTDPKPQRATEERRGLPHCMAKRIDQINRSFQNGSSRLLMLSPLLLALLLLLSTRWRSLLTRTVRLL